MYSLTFCTVISHVLPDLTWPDLFCQLYPTNSLTWFVSCIPRTTWPGLLVVSHVLPDLCVQLYPKCSLTLCTVFPQTPWPGLSVVSNVLPDLLYSIFKRTLWPGLSVISHVLPDLVYSYIPRTLWPDVTLCTALLWTTRTGSGATRWWPASRTWLTGTEAPQIRTGSDTSLYRGAFS